MATIDICISDNLPCSRFVKGVGIGACVKSYRGTVCVCCRFSDVSIFESAIRKKHRSYRVSK